MNTDGTAQNKKVLIVEDEIALAKALELKFKKNSVEALAVFNGEQALAELEKGGYDLMLLDIMMPDVDGWEVMGRMKDKGFKIPIIITSNLSQEEDRQKAMSLGAVDFLVKSDSPIALIVDKAKKLLGQ